MEDLNIVTVGNADYQKALERAAEKLGLPEGKIGCSIAAVTCLNFGFYSKENCTLSVIGDNKDHKLSGKYVWAIIGDEYYVLYDAVFARQEGHKSLYRIDCMLAVKCGIGFPQMIEIMENDIIGKVVNKCLKEIMEEGNGTGKANTGV